jgi:hypothetical protein
MAGGTFHLLEYLYVTSASEAHLAVLTRRLKRVLPAVDIVSSTSMYMTKRCVPEKGE